MLEKANNMQDEATMPDVLPTVPMDFDGVFRFTNGTDEDFTAKWNNIEYTFPANKTSPLIIPNETQEGIQSIRKKFANELGVREFFKSQKGTAMESRAAGPRPALYTDADIAEYVQRCLEPLPIEQAKTRIVKEDLEAVFKKDKRGQPLTRAIDLDDSLIQDGSVVA